jgi:hypothetical protein
LFVVACHGLGPGHIGRNDTSGPTGPIVRNEAWGETFMLEEGVCLDCCAPVAVERVSSVAEMEAVFERVTHYVAPDIEWPTADEEVVLVAYVEEACLDMGHAFVATDIARADDTVALTYGYFPWGAGFDTVSRPWNVAIATGVDGATLTGELVERDSDELEQYLRVDQP